MAHQFNVDDQVSWSSQVNQVSGPYERARSKFHKRGPFSSCVTKNRCVTYVSLSRAPGEPVMGALLAAAWGLLAGSALVVGAIIAWLSTCPPGWWPHSQPGRS